MINVMSKIFSKTVLTVLAAVGMAWPLFAAPSASPARKILSGHVPSAVSALTALGSLPATNVLRLAIGLPVRNQADLDARAQSVSDPSSPNFRQYLTTAQFAEQYGPTTNEVQAVVDFARANGLQVTHVHANRMVIEITGAAPDVQRAFGVTLKTYQHPTENRRFFAPDTEPSVPAGLSINEISGLSSYVRPHSFRKPLVTKAARPASKQAKAASGVPFTGSAPDGSSFMGYDYRNAYVPGTTLTGAGQKIALVQFDGYFQSDIDAYVQLTGLPSLSITNILLDGFDGIPTMTGGETEVELDIEMVNSMAPGISQLLVYEENPNVFNPVVVLSQIAVDNAAKQVSCSWGWSGGVNATVNQIMQQMAVQGQSFFQASGDSDAMLPGDADNPSKFFTTCANPYATSVGGTKLTTGTGGVYVSESVWNDRTPNNGAGGYWGSGGGVSLSYSTPAWQQGFATAANHGSLVGRNFPDVAFTATDVYIIVDNGLAGASGGTSAAAPLWAGFTALINQQAALLGKPPVGFLNPALYNLAKSPAYTSVFNDITNGDNTWPRSQTNYFAIPGYDLATGLGTPHGTNLIFALTSLAVSSSPVISAPPGPWGTNLAVLNGSNPNGAWFLFVQDDAVLDVGMITNGWYVTLTTADLVGQASDNALYASQTNLALPFATNCNLTLSVTNYGPSASAGVQVLDTLPLNGLTLISSNPTAGTVTVSGTTLTWSVGALQTNAGASLTIVLHSVAGGVFTNSATVSSTTTDPNPDDDTVVSSFTVSAPPAPPVLASLPAATATNSFQLYINGDPGYATVVQASTNLINWVNVFTGTPPFYYTNFGTTNYPRRFYRAVVGP